MKLTAENLSIAILSIALIIFILITGGVLLMVNARRQKTDRELAEANYKARINEITFAALRSQMNPHFIFNCLNSIKYFTEQNDSEAASGYLSKFAALIRSTLDNARREKIVLSEEITSVQLYLELEAMRFKNKLAYSISIDDNVDADFVEVPPMIIQPYVENAIWHGLMPLEGGGRLTLYISQSDTFVSIAIDDNGIGREGSARNKETAHSGHKSFGTKITGDRIQLLNEKSEGAAAAGVVIMDKHDQNSKPAGTTVTIKLPLK